jgi:Domain of unknown function (DUF4190)
MNEAERYLQEKSQPKKTSASTNCAEKFLNKGACSTSTESFPTVTGPNGTSGARPKKKALAIASLVCAILGGYASTLTIPAIICGHLALSNIKKDPEQYSGRGLAIAGLVIGYFGLILALVLGATRGVAKSQLEEARSQYYRSVR